MEIEIDPYHERQTIIEAYKALDNLDDIPESIVNGFWAGILALYFPFPEYVITPETWLSNRSRCDLVIFRIGTFYTQNGKFENPVVLVLEGKRRGNASYDKLAQQAQQDMPQVFRYLSTIYTSRLGFDGTTYGIYAAGPTYLICGTPGGSQMYQYSNPNNLTNGSTMFQVKETMHSRTSAHRMLLALRNNIVAKLGPAYEQ